jgi:hypothetical protein
MTVYADYDDDEQRLLRTSLAAAAIAVSAASLGRKEETGSEGFAAASLVLDSRDAYVRNTLVSSVVIELEAEVSAGQAFRDYTKVAAAPGAAAQAMSTLADVVGLLDRKATPEEAAGYKGWLYRIAVTVAQAGKEDQGFLGFGGVQVNDAERAALSAIAEVLGVEAAAPGA